MGRKLKKMLSKEDNGITMSVKFKNQTEKEQFAAVMQDISKNGKAKRVPIPLSLDFKKVNGDYQYPVDHFDNFVDFWVYPGENIAHISIVVDGKNEEYFFSRTITDNTVQLESLKAKAIRITIVINRNSNEISFSYSVHPKEADTVDELIMDCKRLLGVVDTLFNQSNINEKTDDIKKYFNKAIVAYKRSQELAEVLNIKITPRLIVDEDDNEYLLEKFYLLLVKKAIIRQDDKIHNINVDDIENIEIGQTLFATYLQEGDLEIYGEKIRIYTVNCICGAVVKDIEQNKEDKTIVYFEDSEVSPMFKSFSAFLNKDEAEAELNEALEKKDLYYNAKHWITQLQELDKS